MQIKTASSQRVNRRNAKCVLLVEDDVDHRAQLERDLTQAGYEVITASNGRDALDRVRDLPSMPDIVITDWRMPELDGIELCRALRDTELFGLLFIVIVTTQSDEQHLVEAFEAGADDFLVKPFNERELLARLRAGERIVDLERDLERQKREIYRYNAEVELANQQLNQANQQLLTMASTDMLTGLPNRRAAMLALQEQWQLAHAHNGHLACMMLDIDHFKRLNDTLGHNAGDRVLTQVARLMKNVTRSNEFPYRIGGEEFLIVCPRADADMAARGAERIRERIDSTPFIAGDSEVHVTISIGVAEYACAMVHEDELLKAADVALYDAKNAGRNCVRLAPPFPRDLKVAPPSDLDQRASA